MEQKRCGERKTIPWSVIFPVLLFGALFPALLMAKDVPFSDAHGIVTNFEGTRCACPADMDGDGDIDVVGLSFDEDDIICILNTDGNGVAWSGQDVDTDLDGASHACVADIDRDGDLDIAATGLVEDQVIWYENAAGDATVWVPHEIDSFFDGANWVDVADINGDGWPDLLTSAYSDDEITWWINDGTPDVGGWVAKNIDVTLDGPTSVAACDLDLDGDLDVVASSFYSDEVAWFENDGSPDDGGWTKHSLTSALDGARRVITGDISGDGFPDIVATGENQDAIIKWINDGTPGDGGWTQSTLAGSFDGAEDLCLVDLDQDGDLDLFASAYIADKIVWFDNSSGDASSWTGRTVVTSIDYPRGVAAGDIDGDGDPDLLATSVKDNKIAWWENRTIHRNASFALSHTVSSDVDTPRAPVGLYYNNDGFPDVFACSFAENVIKWFSGDGADPPGFTAHSITGSPNGPVDLAFGDIDGNGPTDMVVASYEEHKVLWRQNDSLDPLYKIADDAYNVTAVEIGDINRDGYPDVVYCRTRTAGEAIYRICWKRNDGTPTTVDAGDWTEFSVTDELIQGPVDLALADFDRDGFLDVVASFKGAGRIKWYHSDGKVNPGFTAYNVNTAFSSVNGVAAADMNGDEWIDIIAVRGGIVGLTPFGEVFWFQNDGTPTTAGKYNWLDRGIDGSAPKATDVAVSDFDLDGDMDVIANFGSILNVGAAGVAMYENQGEDPPSFSEHLVFSATAGFTSTTPYAVTGVSTFDIDEDGDPDVLSTDLGGTGLFAQDRVQWHENTGGQFTLATDDTSTDTLQSGQMYDLLKIMLRHNGRAGDDPIQVTALDFLFEESAGDPLTSTEAGNLIGEVSMWFDDDDSGDFDPAVDSRVYIDSTPDFAASGKLNLDVSKNDNFRIDTPGGSNTVFLAVTLQPDAHAATPNQFRVTHVTEESSTAEHFDLGIPLSMQYFSNKSSRVVTVIGGAPTPTPTPTPTPVPGEKWIQNPNMNDGFDVESWRDAKVTVSKDVADDWKCLDGKTIIKIRWWGSFPGYESGQGGEVSPPVDSPAGFLIRCYASVDIPFPQPGKMIKEFNCSGYSQKWHGSIQHSLKPPSYEHEFLYECTLDDSWDQVKDVTYFLSIQAEYKTSSPTYVWGWLNSKDGRLSNAVSRVGAGKWTQLEWPTGHSMEGKPMNMAFELITKSEITPTPTPTPTPSGNQQDVIDYLLGISGSAPPDHNSDTIVDIADLIWLVINE